MGSVPFALCSILYTKPFGDSLGLKRKKSQRFFSDSRLSAFRTMCRRTDSAITGRVPSVVGSPLLSALCLYIKPFGDSGGLKEKISEFFFSDSRLSAFRTMRRRIGPGAVDRLGDALAVGLHEGFPGGPFEGVDQAEALPQEACRTGAPQAVPHGLAHPLREAVADAGLPGDVAAEVRARAEEPETGQVDGRLGTRTRSTSRARRRR